MTIINIQKKIFYLYIIFMPIVVFSPFDFINTAFGEMAGSFSIVFHIIGFVLIMVSAAKEKIKINSFIKYIFFMILILNSLSIVMSLLLNYNLGILHGETTYTATIGMIIYYCHIFLIFYYNYYNLKNIKKEVLNRLLNLIVIFTFCIGYLQIFLLNFHSLVNLYDGINILGILRDSDFLITINRITLMGNEPASAATTLSLLILPFLFAKHLEKDNLKVLFIILMFIPIIYYTKSSTAYIMFAANILVYLFFYFKKNKINLKNIIISTTVFTIALSPFFITTLDTETEIRNEIEYLFLNKITDNTNQSTLARTSTVINDIKVFNKYPISGIGNGNQGFYYNENVPPMYLYSAEVQNLYRGDSGIVNGGPFIPAYISGYGIIGIVLLIIFILKSNRILKNKQGELGVFYEMYYLAAVSFLVSSIMSNDIVGNYIAIFILSLPFMYSNNFKEDI